MLLYDYFHKNQDVFEWWEYFCKDITIHINYNYVPIEYIHDIQEYFNMKQSIIITL